MYVLHCVLIFIYTKRSFLCDADKEQLLFVITTFGEYCGPCNAGTFWPLFCHQSTSKAVRIEQKCDTAELKFFKSFIPTSIEALAGRTLYFFSSHCHIKYRSICCGPKNFSRILQRILNQYKAVYLSGSGCSSALVSKILFVVLLCCRCEMNVYRFDGGCCYSVIYANTLYRNGSWQGCWQTILFSFYISAPSNI